MLREHTQKNRQNYTAKSFLQSIGTICCSQQLPVIQKFLKILGGGVLVFWASIIQTLNESLLCCSDKCHLYMQMNSFLSLASSLYFYVGMEISTFFRGTEVSGRVLRELVSVSCAVMCRLTKGIYSERCVVRQLHHCVNTWSALTQTYMVWPATHLGCVVKPVAPRLQTCIAGYRTEYCRQL